MRQSSLTNVVFPAPFSPTSATVVPAGMRRLRSVTYVAFGAPGTEADPVEYEVSRYDLRGRRGVASRDSAWVSPYSISHR